MRRAHTDAHTAPDGGSTSKYGWAAAPLVKFRQIRLVKVWARLGPTLDKPSNSGLSAGPERGVLPPAPTVVVQLYRTTTVHMHIYEVHHVSITSDCAASTSAVCSLRCSIALSPECGCVSCYSVCTCDAVWQSAMQTCSDVVKFQSRCGPSRQIPSNFRASWVPETARSNLRQSLGGARAPTTPACRTWTSAAL